MRILLHVCCGPCTVYPLRVLREQGHEVRGFFCNPNIHPFQEFDRRVAAMRHLAERERFPVEIDDRYGLREYLRRVVNREDNRCLICYDMRLAQTAEKAGRKGYDAFTSTLLYSRYQQHEQIRDRGMKLAKKFGVVFYYEDFRAGWQEGIDRSREMGLYRQPYCGCIYSEQERYDRTFRKNRKKEQEGS